MLGLRVWAVWGLWVRSFDSSRFRVQDIHTKRSYALLYAVPVMVIVMWMATAMIVMRRFDAHDCRRCICDEHQTGHGSQQKGTSIKTEKL